MYLNQFIIIINIFCHVLALILKLLIFVITCMVVSVVPVVLYVSFWYVD